MHCGGGGGGGVVLLFWGENCYSQLLWPWSFLKDYFFLAQDLLVSEYPDRAATEVICHAHQHEISCISINQLGTRIATSSSKVRGFG